MDYLIQTNESYNSYYKMYKASWCRKSGLPMYQKKDFDTVKKLLLYTKSRARREKVEIDTTTVAGWYRRPNGYTPLFREKMKAVLISI